MSTEIAVQPKAQIAVGSRGVHLATVDDAMRFSKAVIMAGMAPSSFKTAEAVFIAIQYGAEIGFPPMQALQSIAVINGRPCVWGDGLVAVVRGSGECEYIREWIEGEGDGRTAWCETKRRGEPQSVSQKFSVGDAKAAGLWMKKSRDGKPSPWCQYPDRMLAMRARAFCLRDVYADFLRGFGVREEVEDYSPMPVVAVESKPVRRLSDLGTPEPVDAEPVADVTPEPATMSAAFASLLDDAKRITDGNSQEADELLAEVAAELDSGTITADEAAQVQSVLAGAVPFG
jgi:hypothetical protein